MHFENPSANSFIFISAVYMAAYASYTTMLFLIPVALKKKLLQGSPLYVVAFDMGRTGKR